MTMPVPSQNASSATKLKWLRAQGWHTKAETAQGQHQLTCSLPQIGTERVFCGKTYAQAVNEAFEGIAETSAALRCCNCGAPCTETDLYLCGKCEGEAAEAYEAELVAKGADL